MSSESRLRNLGLSHLQGQELLQAINQRIETLQSDQAANPVDKTLDLTALDLERQRLQALGRTPSQPSK